MKAVAGQRFHRILPDIAAAVVKGDHHRVGGGAGGDLIERGRTETDAAQFFEFLLEALRRHVEEWVLRADRGFGNAVVGVDQRSMLGHLTLDVAAEDLGEEGVDHDCGSRLEVFVSLD